MVKCVGDMNGWTIASVKLATISFVIIILKLWGGAMAWVQNTNLWWFIGAFAIFVLMSGAGCESCCGKSLKKSVKKKKK